MKETYQGPVAALKAAKRKEERERQKRLECCLRLGWTNEHAVRLLGVDLERVRETRRRLEEK